MAFTSPRVVPATVDNEEFFYFFLGRLNSGECSRRISKYHEIAGYLWRMEWIQGGANNGGSSIQVTCGGPVFGEDEVVTRRWRISVRIRVILIHPTKWSTLNIDPSTSARHATGMCTNAFGKIPKQPLDFEVTGDAALSSKLNTWVRYVFAPAACLQPGVYCDSNWNAVLCAGITPNSAWSPVPIPLVPVDDDSPPSSPPQSVSYGNANNDNKQMRAKTSNEILTDHLEIRAALVDKLIDLDTKLSACKNAESSAVVEEEIERMKTAWECLPDLSMLV